jgi:hypothetical protein
MCYGDTVPDTVVMKWKDHARTVARDLDLKRKRRRLAALSEPCLFLLDSSRLW